MKSYTTDLLNFERRSNLIDKQTFDLKNEIISSLTKLFEEEKVSVINFDDYEIVIYNDIQFHIYGIRLDSDSITLVNSSEVIYIDYLSIDVMLNIYEASFSTFYTC